ncbi:glycerophosphodiester phosphodiesterase [Glycomyces sp. TRM65418]|uniref:glycerophosphodiester phosphodiesterase family protein n=1 Tax=Glycomyces sp. TRM65418 TaxID=2867006 RepID=UPI001CE6BECA|nr:glycerophosphodiester phosphodiesterase family protein [Glycomyces sp. TRM65418]MCC3765769.1 glycerophosphodiester phosphodiesterase [Glycomyces sp. TRM65418]QZD55359.1 glycerophosphodiester phosphodiesterase [Glycomyces sp. TRM65418]
MSRKSALLRGAAAIAAAGVLVGLAAAPAAAKPHHHHDDDEPIVIAHRGASGYLPEHTLEAYQLAIELGADVIEPDLVLTADGELLARHEPVLDETTDVAEHPEFADRKTTKLIDGKPVTGFFADDFTLAELKTLRAEERLPELRPESAEHDGEFQLVTYDEILDYVATLGKKKVVTYPEMKHPAYYEDQGMSIEDALADLLEERKLDRKRSPVWIQSFEYQSLLNIAERVDNPIGLNIDGQGAIADAQLDEYAETLDTVSLNKNRIFPRGADGSVSEPTDIVERAHDRGLDVHVWTFRAENQFLPANLREGADPAEWGDYEAEYELFYDLGVDAVFSDFPDLAVAARDDC